MTALSCCMIRLVTPVSQRLTVAPCMRITIKLYYYLSFSINKGSSKKLMTPKCTSNETFMSVPCCLVVT